MGDKMMKEKEAQEAATADNVSLELAEEKHEDAAADERGNWSRKMDFILSCLSYAVGLGNVWRFPYLCYRNGGGAFLIPFMVMLFITGIPLVFLELSFGQFASSGVVSIWKACPIFQGVGWGMFIVSVLISVYYNMIIAWSLFYLFASFTKYLPWASCGVWSSEACSLVAQGHFKNCTNNNGTWYNETCFTLASAGEELYNLVLNLTNNTENLEPHSPSDEYFHRYVLNITDSISDIGGLRWQLVLCLLLAWILVCLCLAKGIKTSGKAVYFTAFFPYVVLTILLIRGLTLPGSANGILYYLTPEWHRLAHAKVWGDAAVQIFFSLSPCWGGLITLASYNKFHNNCFRDAIIVSVMDCATSIFAGLVIFAIIGYMAHELQVSIDEVATEGAGLAFVVYPEVVTKLPISQLWSILFFAMLITLGLGTQIATVTTVHTTLLDYFPEIFRKGRRPTYLLFGVATGSFIIGLAFCTQGGMYVLQLFDNYAATYSLLAIGMVECVALSWVYGVDRFMDDIESMLGTRPHKIWKYCWQYIAPIALLAILIFTWIDFKPTEYNKQVFPAWADGVGWCVSLVSILIMPIVAIYLVIKTSRGYNMTYMQALRKLTKPTADWGPARKVNRDERNQRPIPSVVFESQVPLTLGSKQSMDTPNGQIKNTRL